MVTPVSAVAPCTPMNSASRWSERIAPMAIGPTSDSEGVAHAADQHDGLVGARLEVEDVGDRDRVRHDRQLGHAGEVVGEPPGRRAAREPDRLARLDELGRLARDRLLLEQLALGLGLEPGLLGAEAAEQRRAAVDLLQQPGRGQRVQVPADRHLRDREQPREVAHPHGSAPAQLVHDHSLALNREHVLTIMHGNEHVASRANVR